MAQREKRVVGLLAAFCVKIGISLMIVGLIRWIAADRTDTLGQFREMEHMGKSLTAIGVVLLGLGFLLKIKIRRSNFQSL